MAEWNQPPGGSMLTLDAVLGKIQQRLNKVKSGPIVPHSRRSCGDGLLDRMVHSSTPKRQVIVQRFGEVMRTAGPGLHLKMPYGIEKVHLVPTARVLKEEFGLSNGVRSSRRKGPAMIRAASTKTNR